jgi:transcriptional regulator with PAS, ATPase and Fis domain
MLLNYYTIVRPFVSSFAVDIDIAKVVGICATAVGAFFWKQILQFFNYLKRMTTLRKQDRAMFMNMATKFDAISADISDVKKELISEGGTSLREDLAILGKRSVLTQNLTWSILDESRYGVVITDLDGNWIRMNKALTRKLLKTKDDLCNRAWQAFLSQDCRRYVVSEYEKAITDKIGTDFKLTFNVDNIMVVHANMVIELVKYENIVSGFKITFTFIN